MVAGVAHKRLFHEGGLPDGCSQPVPGLPMWIHLHVRRTTSGARQGRWQIAAPQASIATLCMLDSDMLSRPPSVLVWQT